LILPSGRRGGEERGKKEKKEGRGEKKG